MAYFSGSRSLSGGTAGAPEVCESTLQVIPIQKIHSAVNLGLRVAQAKPCEKTHLDLRTEVST
jgi:hypothetical protein